MNKTLFAAAVLAAATAIPAAAQETPWYLTGSVGRSTYDISGFSGDNKDTSFNVGLGFNVSKNLAIEAGYADFGKLNFSGFSGEAKTTYAGLILSAPFGDRFSVYGRLAAASTSRKVGGFGVSESERKTEALYGVGFGYDFSRNLTGIVEYQKLSDSDVSAINAGIRIGF